MLENLFSVLFLSIQFYLSFYNPKLFFLLYLLFISSFLGFFNDELIINGSEVGYFVHSMIFLLHYAFGRNAINKKQILPVLDLIILFFIYGIFKPYFDDISSINESIIGSKHFSSLFLAHYLFSKKNSFQNIFLEKVIGFYGYYFIFIFISFLTLNIIPPFYVKDITGIEINYPTIFSLFLFIKAASSKKVSQKLFTFFLLLIWTYGMIFEGHSALMLTTTFGCLLFIFKIPLTYFAMNTKRLLLGFFLLLALIVIFPNILIALNDAGSIQSRLITNLDRVQMIIDNPYVGYGFLSYDSLNFMNENKYAIYSSTIDNGYIDFILKFGMIGCIAFLLIFYKIIISQNNSVKDVALKVFLIQYIFVNITWSVYLFAVGNIALCLATFLIINNE